MATKFLYFTNILAPYRIGLYNAMAESLDYRIKFFFNSFRGTYRRWNIDPDKIRFAYEVKIKQEGLVNLKLVYVIVNLLYRYFPVYVMFEIVRHRPKIIYTTEMGARTILAILAAKIIKAKVFLISEVTPLSENKIAKIRLLARKIICRYVDKAIATSKFSAEYLVLLGIKRDNIIITHEAVDNAYYAARIKEQDRDANRAELMIEKGSFVFLYVGQFIYRKGLDLLVGAFNSLDKEGKEGPILVLVGGAEKQLRKITQHYHREKIRIIDFKQSKDLIKYYSIADCFILPSRKDVWGMVVNEALACDIPVIVSKYAGCAGDLIEDGINGYIFDPLDSDSFRATMKNCLARKDLLPGFVKRSRERLDSYYNYNVASKIICEINHLPTATVINKNLKQAACVKKNIYF